MSSPTVRYPFVPKTNSYLRPGDLWSVPLSNGRFACLRVLAVPSGGRYGARVNVDVALLDWTGDAPPTSESVAGAVVIHIATVHVRAVAASGGAVVGNRPIALDGIQIPERIDTFWGDAYPKQRAEQLFVEGDPPPAWEIRDISSPLTDDMLKPLEAASATVQFSRMLTDAEFIVVSEWMAAQNNVTLRFYGAYDGTTTSLEFLRFFPTLRGFSADALYDSLLSLDGLRHLGDGLESLTIGQTKARLDLTPLARFRSLKSLYLEGQTKNLDVVSGLTTIDDLTLRSITLPGLELFTRLPLTSLDLKLGGTRNLAALPRFERLRYLELWMIKGLEDLGAVSQVTQLEHLFLQALAGVTQLPDLRRLERLRIVHLETMKRLSDLSPLASAPALEHLDLIDMRHLTLDDLAPLVDHPTLRTAQFGLGSRRKNDAARALFRRD